MPLRDRILVTFSFVSAGFGVVLPACDTNGEKCLGETSAPADYIAACRSVLNTAACCTTPTGESHPYEISNYQLDGQPPTDGTDFVCELLWSIGATTCDVERCADELREQGDACAWADEPVCVAVDFVRNGWMQPIACPEL